MTPILAFDLETVPDLEGIRRLNGLPADLPDADVAEGYAQARRSVSGSDFPPHYLHKVVAIACALGYLDYRFGHIRWRETRPRLATWFEEFLQRPSMQRTMPPEKPLQRDPTQRIRCSLRSIRRSPDRICAALAGISILAFPRLEAWSFPSVALATQALPEPRCG